MDKYLRTSQPSSPSASGAIDTPALIKTVRAVVLGADGKSFSAGADLNWMKRMSTYSHQQNVTDANELYDMFQSISACPIPVISAINGNAFGGGCGLIAASDFSFSVSSALFGFTEVRLGLIPAVISPFVMQKIGSANCMRYFSTGERFNAAEAQRIQLIQQHVASPQELDETVSKAVKEIASSSPAAVYQAKRLVQHVSRKLFAGDELKSFVAGQIAGVRSSGEGRHGLNAFLNKEKPFWGKD